MRPPAVKYTAEKESEMTAHNGSRYHIGIDIGFGDCKVLATGPNGSNAIKQINFKFPTAIARGKLQMIEGLGEQDKTYTFRGRPYIVGAEAFDIGDIYDTRSLDFLMTYSPLLVFRALQDAAETFRRPLGDLIKHIRKVGVGLPLAWFKAQRQALADTLRAFEVNGEHINLRDRVVVKAQGQGIYYDFLFANNRQEYAWAFSDGGKNLMIIDIGFNTVDILVIMGGKANGRLSDMYEGEGVCKVVKDLAKAIKIQTRQSLSEQEAKDVLHKGFLYHDGEKLDMSEVIKELISDYADLLVRRIDAQYHSELSKMHKLILAGGGASLIGENFRQRFRSHQGIHIPAPPEYSNARGYLEFVKGM